MGYHMYTTHVKCQEHVTLFIYPLPIMQLNACRKKKTNAVNQKHFFENPNRYDETEQLLHPSLQARPSAMTSTQMSIPSLTGSITNITSHNPHYSSASAGYGSNSSLAAARNHSSTRLSINNYHGSGALPAVMPGTTPPQLFTSPSFFDR